MKPSVLLVSSALLTLALAASAAAFDDVHLNEITEDARTYAETRVAALDAVGSLTKPQKKERRTLRKLFKRLDKTSSKLSQEFGELKATAAAHKKLKDAAVGLEPGLDAAIAGAGLHLSERRDYVDAHLPLIVNPKKKAGIGKLLDKAKAARAEADLEAEDPVKRAKLLAKAQKLLTGALKKAEKAALRDSGRKPPVRFRSGDEIGQVGGVVAVPSDDPSNIAGYSIEIPSGVLPTGTVIRLETADSFVGGDDQPAGNAVRIRPDSLIFQSEVLVRVRYLLPPDSDVLRLALFQQRGMSVEAGLGGTLDGEFLTFGVKELGVFQAGVQAPPPGTPDGRYHVHSLTIVTTTDTMSASVVKNASVTGQDYVFNPTQIGSRQLVPNQSLTRQLIDESPNHVEAAAGGFSGGVDFAWERVDDGRFRFSYNEGTSVVDVEGVASDDGAVISFTGHGENLEIFAVGVRDPKVLPTAADLNGRWAAVELGVSLRGGTGTPFGTRYTNGFRLFDANGVDGWIYDAGGDRYHTDLTYNTNSAGAEHTSGVTLQPDGGGEDFSVQFNGQVIADTDLDGNPRRSGRIDTANGVFVSTRADLPAQEISLMVAVRQPGGSSVGTFDGVYGFARMAVDVTTSNPADQMSSHTIFPVAGAFDVQPGGATMTPENGQSARYTITGTPPLNAMTWDLVRTLTQVGTASTQVNLMPDADGNHRPVSDDWWYGIGDTGTIVIGMTPAEALQARRGIFVGVK